MPLDMMEEDQEQETPLLESPVLHGDAVRQREALPFNYFSPRLVVSFEDCQFLDNRDNNHMDMESDLFVNGIITVFNLFHNLTIKNCTFENNDYSYFEVSHVLCRSMVPNLNL